MCVPQVSLGLSLRPSCCFLGAWLSGSVKSNTLLSQFVLAALVLSLLLPKTSQYIKWIVAAGLAQVSEFSFVLGSRARRAGIISREVSLPHFR